MLLTLFKKELLDQWRSKKILILSFLFLFVAISSPVIAKIIPQLLSSLPGTGIQITIPEPTFRDAIDQFVKNLSQIGVFVLIFVFAGVVADEKVKKTLEILLTKPISRTSFILAKFAASIKTMGLIYILCSLIFYIYTVALFGGFSFLNFAILALIIFLFLSLVAAITLFGSTILSSSIAAAGFGFVGFIAFGVITNLFKAIKDYSPGYIFNNYRGLIDKGWDIKFLPSILITFGLIYLFTFLAVVLFKRQEIER